MLAETCLALSLFAKEVMILRQEGLTKHALIQLVNTAKSPSNELTLGLIELAYTQPLELIEQHKITAVAQFGSRVLQSCGENENERTTHNKRENDGLSSVRN